MREGVGLLFLLRMQVGSDHQPLNGEVEDEWSDGSIKHCAGQELIGQVDGEEIGLTGSVQPLGRDTHNAANRNALGRYSDWRASFSKLIKLKQIIDPIPLIQVK